MYFQFPSHRDMPCDQAKDAILDSYRFLFQFPSHRDMPCDHAGPAQEGKL